MTRHQDPDRMAKEILRKNESNNGSTIDGFLLKKLNAKLKEKNVQGEERTAHFFSANWWSGNELK